MKLNQIRLKPIKRPNNNRLMIQQQSGSQEVVLKSIEDLSSNILIQKPSSYNQQWLTIYIPAYVRLDILRFQELVVPQQTAKISAKVYFDLDITKLTEKVVEAIIQNMKWHLLYQDVQMRDFNEESDNLDKIQPIGRFKIDGKQLLRYEIQKKFQARAITNIIWTPFQVTRLLISLRIETIEIEAKDAKNKEIFASIQNNLKNPFRQIDGKTKGLAIKFNAMDYRYDLERVRADGKLVGDMAQIMYNHDVSVGLYELSQRIMSIENTNSNFSQLEIQIGKQVISELQESCWVKLFANKKVHPYKQVRPYQVEDESQSEKLANSKNNSDCFNNVHFTLPLSRRPLVSIFELMIPGYILGLISLVIYFQSGRQDGLSNRLGSIATIMLAYIALQPVVRQKIPPTPKLTIVEVVGHLQILITVLCLVESFVYTVQQSYEFVWYTNPFFLISLIIQVFATFIFFMAVGTYYTVWISKYSIKTGMRVPFKPHQWNNTECDKWLLNECIGKQGRKIQIL